MQRWATEMLEGYRPRTAGEVQVLGHDPAHPSREWRSRIRLVLQACQLPTDLTVRELWGAAGPLMAAKYFRWKPTRE
jgi:ABC-type multidrug transport system ATPase subunit